MEKLAKELNEKQAKEIKAKFDEAVEAAKKNSKSDIEKTRLALEEALEKKLGEDSSYIKEMQKQLDEISAKMKDSNKTAGKSLKEILAKDAKYQAFVKGDTQKMVLELKADALDILVGDYAGSQELNDTFGATTRLPGITNPATRQPFIQQLVNVGQTTKPIINYVQSTVTDNSADYAEGASAPQSKIAWTAATSTVKKIGHYMKMSYESMDDYSYVQSEIRNTLIKYLQLEIDRTILTGATGSGDAFDGIVTSATAFNATTAGMALAIANPTRFDAIKAGATQVRVANFNPNYAIMNPKDAALMEVSKDTTGQYILPPFYSNGTKIDGLAVITNNAMTADKFLIGDFSKSNVFFKDNIEIEIFRENEDDALNELVTMKARARLTHFIKSNEATAFVYGDFSDAITALTEA